MRNDTAESLDLERSLALFCAATDRPTLNGLNEWDRRMLLEFFTAEMRKPEQPELTAQMIWGFLLSTPDAPTTAATIAEHFYGRARCEVDATYRRYKETARIFLDAAVEAGQMRREQEHNGGTVLWYLQDTAMSIGDNTQWAHHV